MTNPVETERRDPAPARRKVSRLLRASVPVAIAIIVITWLTVSPNVTEQADAALLTTVPSGEVIAKPNSAAVEAEGNDVGAVTDAASLPMEDANPNPVVPQNAVIPPVLIPATPQD
jgi:hypothetical protein